MRKLIVGLIVICCALVALLAGGQPARAQTSTPTATATPTSVAGSRWLYDEERPSNAGRTIRIIEENPGSMDIDINMGCTGACTPASGTVHMRYACTYEWSSNPNGNSITINSNLVIDNQDIDQSPSTTICTYPNCPPAGGGAISWEGSYNDPSFVGHLNGLIEWNLLFSTNPGTIKASSCIIEASLDAYETAPENACEVNDIASTTPGQDAVDIMPEIEDWDFLPYETVEVGQRYKLTISGTWNDGDSIAQRWDFQYGWGRQGVSGLREQYGSWITLGDTSPANGYECANYDFETNSWVYYIRALYPYIAIRVNDSLAAFADNTGTPSYTLEHIVEITGACQEFQLRNPYFSPEQPNTTWVSTNQELSIGYVDPGIWNAWYVGQPMACSQNYVALTLQDDTLPWLYGLDNSRISRQFQQIVDWPGCGTVYWRFVATNLQWWRTPDSFYNPGNYNFQDTPIIVQMINLANGQSYTIINETIAPSDMVRGPGGVQPPLVVDHYTGQYTGGYVPAGRYYLRVTVPEPPGDIQLGETLLHYLNISATGIPSPLASCFDSPTPTPTPTVDLTGTPGPTRTPIAGGTPGPALIRNCGFDQYSNEWILNPDARVIQDYASGNKLLYTEDDGQSYAQQAFPWGGGTMFVVGKYKRDYATNYANIAWHQVMPAGSYYLRVAFDRVSIVSYTGYETVLVYGGGVRYSDDFMVAAGNYLACTSSTPWTATPVPTRTITRTPTAGPSPTPTLAAATSTPTAFKTWTPVPTRTSTGTATDIPTSTMFPTDTAQPTSTVGAGTATSTPPPTYTPYPTYTPPPPSATATSSPTADPNATNTPVPPQIWPTATPPQQPPMGCNQECYRPGNALELAGWLEYGRCEAFKQIAWCPYHSATMVAIPTQVRGREPFASFDEMASARSTIVADIASYDWQPVGTPIGDPDTEMWSLDNDSPWNGQRISVLDYSAAEYSTTCTLEMQAIVGSRMSPSICFIFDVLRRLALIPYFQLFINGSSLYALLLYFQHNWIKPATT